MFTRHFFYMTLVGVLSLSGGSSVFGQASVPTVLSSGTNTTLSGPPALGDATLTNATGTAGNANGFHQYQWGNTSAPGFGILQINGTTSSPVPITLRSAVLNPLPPAPGPYTVTPGVAATNFDSTQPYSWKLFSAAAVGGTSISTIRLRTLASEGGTVAYYTPNSTSNSGGADDVRLNQIFQLQANNFYDNLTGLPITGSSGYVGPGFLASTFSWRLTDYSATAGGYQSLTLQYTPVPEPGVLLGFLATAGFIFSKTRR